MPKTITDEHLRLLIDLLVQEGTRVVGPRRAGTMTLYEPLATGNDLDLSELPRRSAKETLFPVCETILTYEKGQEGVKIHDIAPAAFPETVLVGVRPCDAAAAPVLDHVFSWDYHDEFFLARRAKTTVIGIACTTADAACFCTAVGLSPVDPAGSDLFLNPLAGGGFACLAMTDKGKALLGRYPQCFGDADPVRPVTPAAPQGERLDLGRIKAWLDTHFEDPLWAEIAARCAGCGACAFLCPACHCFDISDEGTEQQGARRKHWDACGFGKFTNHASGHNPRDGQSKRYRNRLMHKFKYYHDKFGQTLCTGCGRCIRHCPVGIDLKEILDEINERP